MSLADDAKDLALNMNGRPPTDNEAREIGRGRQMAREVIDAIRAEKVHPDTLIGAIHFVRQEGGDHLVGFFREVCEALGRRS